jgi:hypothetical protein
MHNDVKLRAPMEVTGDDVEMALFVQSLDEPAAARVLDRLRGAAAERAAKLNHALDIDIFEMLTSVGQGARGEHCGTAERVGAGPPALVSLGRHNIASTSRVVLDSSVAQRAAAADTDARGVADVQRDPRRERGRIEVSHRRSFSHRAAQVQGVPVKEHATASLAHRATRSARAAHPRPTGSVGAKAPASRREQSLDWQAAGGVPPSGEEKRKAARSSR